MIDSLYPADDFRHRITIDEGGEAGFNFVKRILARAHRGDEAALNQLRAFVKADADFCNLYLAFKRKVK